MKVKPVITGCSYLEKTRYLEKDENHRGMRLADHSWDGLEVIESTDKVLFGNGIRGVGGLVDEVGALVDRPGARCELRGDGAARPPVPVHGARRHQCIQDRGPARIHEAEIDGAHPEPGMDQMIHLRAERVFHGRVPCQEVVSQEPVVRHVQPDQIAGGLPVHVCDRVRLRILWSGHRWDHENQRRQTDGRQ